MSSSFLAEDDPNDTNLVRFKIGEPWIDAAFSP